MSPVGPVTSVSMNDRWKMKFGDKIDEKTSNSNGERIMLIAVDFDGTCVTHEYPKIGRDIGAVPVLSALADRGHQLILFTMRSGKELMDAVRWFEENDIPLYGVNNNPRQHTWTSSPKVYAKVYIDDAALGAPLIVSSIEGERPYIDWGAVAEYFGISIGEEE